MRAPVDLCDRRIVPHRMVGTRGHDTPSEQPRVGLEADSQGMLAYVKRTTVKLPDVVGQTTGDAETKLAQAGLKGVVQFHVPSAQPAGTVVAQNPAGGQARKGSEVKLNVSTGTGAGASGATGATGPTGATGTG